MKTKLQKMEILQEKIKQLKDKQNEIEEDIKNGFVQVLRIKEAFQIDFDSMVGGILEVISTIRSDSEKKEEWRLIGQKFCKARIKRKHKSTSQSEPTMEENYV